MTMNSRGFPKSNRASNVYEGGAFLGRPSDNAYEYNSSSRNYNTSRDGIFASELTKREMKKKESQIPLQIQEVPDYSGSKRASSRRSGLTKESRDEYYRQSDPQEIINDNFTREIQELKVELYRVMRESYKEQGVKYDKILAELISQVNAGFKKNEEVSRNISGEVVSTQNDLKRLASAFQTFSLQNEEKLETLVNEMAAYGGGAKKSKTNGDYGMDIKNSFQGMASSISVNNDICNTKIVSEVIAQIEALKKEVTETKLEINGLHLKLNSKLVVKDQKKPQPVSHKLDTLLKDQVLQMIEKKAKQERRLLDEKVEGMEMKLLGFRQILEKQEENIFGMNEQLKNTINLQINPKIKRAESSITEISNRTEPNIIASIVKTEVDRQIEQKVGQTRIIKARGCKENQSKYISAISGMNSDRITHRETYLLDEENYLLDSEGRYLLQQFQGNRQKIRLDQGALCLLRLHGMQVGQG